MLVEGVRLESVVDALKDKENAKYVERLMMNAQTYNPNGHVDVKRADPRL